jgi:hypothetical protein
VEKSVMSEYRVCYGIDILLVMMPRQKCVLDLNTMYMMYLVSIVSAIRYRSRWMVLFKGTKKKKRRSSRCLFGNMHYTATPKSREAKA